MEIHEYQHNQAALDSASPDKDEESVPLMHGDWTWNGECWVKADGHAYDPVLKRLFKDGVLVFQEDCEEHGAEGGHELEGSAHREGEHEACDAVTYGDWIWDGEMWVTADGFSYHPLLQQLFKHGERVMHESCEDSERLRHHLLAQDYVANYGTERSVEIGKEEEERKAQGERVTLNEAEEERGVDREQVMEGEDASEQLAGASGEGAKEEEEGASRKIKRYHVVGTSGGTLGRSKESTVFVPRSKLSRTHARIVWTCEDSSFVLLDCNSRRGTFCDGRRAGSEEGVKLRRGSIFCLGQLVSFRVKRIERKETGEEIHFEEIKFKEQHAIEAPSRPVAPPRVYRDRAAERRCLYNSLESQATRQKYSELQREQAAREEEFFSRQDRLTAVAQSLVESGRATACKSKCESTSEEEEEEEDPEWLQRGRKMLEKMGWEHGKGLGKHKQVKLRYVARFLFLNSSQGISAPIIPSSTLGKSGIGADR